jgi:hypothetical protein
VKNVRVFSELPSVFDELNTCFAPLTVSCPPVVSPLTSRVFAYRPGACNVSRLFARSFAAFWSFGVLTLLVSFDSFEELFAALVADAPSRGEADLLRRLYRVHRCAKLLAHLTDGAEMPAPYS